MDKHYLKYGGVRFVKNAPQEEINSFVNSLPEEERSSLQQVVTRLEEAGLITLLGDTTTIDQELEPFLVPNTDDL
ncbi:MAG TPA: hypothetical protein PLM25_04455 [Limnochordia bacterium]|jgi:hypothetical protein|nr:hypothetical protein [Limnochordia bacterium]